MKLALIFMALIAVVISAPPHLKPSRSEPSTPNHVNLKPLLDKYMALIDWDDVKDFIRTKLESHDPDIFKIVLYLFEDDCKTIIDFLWDRQEFVDLIKWLYDSGLTSIYNDLEKLHEFFGWRPITSPVVINKRTSKNIRSIGALLEEFLELIPMNQLVDMTLELFSTNDPSLLSFYIRLRCPDMAKLWGEFKNLHEVQQLFELLKDEGVNIDSIIIIVESIFNWKRESKTQSLYRFNLHPALDQIVEVIDFKNLKQFLHEIQSTPCGRKAIHYIRSDDFDKLITDFYGEKEFKNVLDWMKSNGLDQLYEFIKEIHNHLDISKPPYPKQNEECSAEQWNDILEQLNKFIPQDQLIDISYELIKNDEAIQHLLQILASNPVEKAYHHFRSQNSYKLFLEKLRATGLEIDKFITLIEALMGWDNRPRKNLP